MNLVIGKHHGYVLLAIATVALLPSTSVAEDWPAFRGINGDGISTELSVPTHWERDVNERWSVALDAAGNSSPIVSNGRVFLHTASTDGRVRSLSCFDREDGREHWTRSVSYDQVDQTHKTNPYDASTPVADGSRVVVWHGSAGLHCYDFAGEELWSRDLGKIDHFLGYASSPIIVDGAVILNVGPGVDQRMLAVELGTGDTIWETPEPGGNAGQRPREVASFSTPVLGATGDRQQIINNMPTRVVAYDPADGEVLWSIEGMAGRQDLVYTSPILAGDIGVAMAGFKGPRMAYRLDGSGNATESHRLWHIAQRNPQRIGTGVFINDHIFTANVGPGTIECIDPQTGEFRWQTRSPGGDSWASVLYAAGHLYITDQQGTTHVVLPDTDGFQLVSSNALDETTNATPAISEGEIFIRTHQHLYCISE